MSDTAEALNVEYVSAPTSPSPPPSPLSLLSLPLPQIPSPPLPVPSPPLPLPSLPTTSPTYDEASLGYKAARIRLRAASPSTHHPSEIPSPPLFKVEESSSAAAARQVGHTLAHTVDYGFIDTMDASIRAAERRGDNFARWLLLTSVRPLLPDRHGFTLRVGSRPWRARLELCKGMVMYYRGPQDGPADVVVYLAKMPPKKRTATITTTTTPMTDAQLKALISQGVVDALAERDANRSRNDDDSHDAGSDRRRRMPVARECPYSDFLKYQPLNFKGAEGLGNALTWWNSHVKTVGHDVAYAMTWKALKKMMTDNTTREARLRSWKLNYET
ncbi:hypothetical protein Tco_0198958 [Tanacetum coccineum]